MVTPDLTPPENITHADLVTLTSWMAENDYSTEEIVRVVEKPWNYLGELQQAKLDEADEAQE